jgi:hypothetical protein
MPKSGPETAAVTARYREFAAEARGRSPRYEELALAALHTLVSRRRDELAGIMLQRRTQTNEPARCDASDRPH